MVSWHLGLASNSQPSKLYCQNFSWWLLNFTVAFGLDLLQIKSDFLNWSLQCHLLEGIREYYLSQPLDWVAFPELSLRLKQITSSLGSHPLGCFSASVIFELKCQSVVNLIDMSRLYKYLRPELFRYKRVNCTWFHTPVEKEWHLFLYQPFWCCLF